MLRTKELRTKEHEPFPEFALITETLGLLDRLKNSFPKLAKALRRELDSATRSRLAILEEDLKEGAIRVAEALAEAEFPKLQIQWLASEAAWIVAPSDPEVARFLLDRAEKLGFQVTDFLSYQVHWRKADAPLRFLRDCELLVQIGRGYRRLGDFADAARAYTAVENLLNRAGTQLTLVARWRENEALAAKGELRLENQNEMQLLTGVGTLADLLYVEVQLQKALLYAEPLYSRDHRDVIRVISLRRGRETLEGVFSQKNLPQSLRTHALDLLDRIDFEEQIDAWLGGGN